MREGTSRHSLASDYSDGEREDTDFYKIKDICAFLMYGGRLICLLCKM